MRILYLYHRLKCGGLGYHKSFHFTEILQTHHCVDFRYIILSQEDFESADNNDPAYPEIIGSKEFADVGYDCVIVDGRIYESRGCPRRIPRDILASFHHNGGIMIFLYDDIDSIWNRRISTQDIGEYLGACNHGHGGLSLTKDPHRIIKGIQNRDTHVEIEVTDEYLDNFEPFIRQEVYRGVKKLVAEQPVHLGIADHWLCIGDKRTFLLDDTDLFSDTPRPLVFANLSTHVGATAMFTGNIWKDYVNDKNSCDNLVLMSNIVQYLAFYQHSMKYHRQKPTVFLSYSHADKGTVQKLATMLVESDIDVWVDEKEIGVGQSISKKIEEGLRKADYYLLVLSRHSLNSRWVETEYRTALTIGIRENRHDWIIPVVTDITDEQMMLFSPILGDRKYANLRKGMDSGLDEILKVIK